jgi:Tfp pilus assembly protein PilP
VGTLRLVGVLKAPDGSAALLEDFEGYGYILKDGDQVKNGYVVQIGQDKIIFQIKEYGWSRTIALRLETE